MQRSLLALQTIQAQQAAQSAARNLSFSATSGTTRNVANGLAVGGLVPGVASIDPTDPNTAGANVSIPVTTNANGTSAVTLGANGSITLPPSATGDTVVTVSGMGTAGSVTSGSTITPLTAGVSTSVAPGSTISLPQGGTITFAAGSSAVPSALTTYVYPTPATATTAAGTASVPTSWSGVGGLSQSTFGPDATTVTVTQTAQQALLTWQSFNIGKGTTLDFDQSLGGANVGDWVAINKVAANIAPSDILGAIEAPGQVYVINQNGIIFGGSSQVNVGALVASSLPINTNLVSRGLLNNPDYQFLFSQIDIPAGTKGTPAFTPQGTSSAPGSAPAPGSYGDGGVVSQVDSSGNVTQVAAAGEDGDVVVEAGAQITTPTTAQHVGGKAALIGPNVSNGGTISSPDGQVILAAGLQVEFQASSDPSLRGLDVSVGEVADPKYDGGAAVSGTATNLGDIEAARADAMITGENVNQFGLINSSTSVALNGRVDLLADYGAKVLVNSVNGFEGTSGLYLTQAGAVTLGSNSLTQIQPELDSTDEVVGLSLALPSAMMIQGKTIDFQTNAQVLAPAANLTLNAGNFLSTGLGYSFFNTTGQVYLDTGATIDVSGSENVAASVTDNIIPVQLLGSELANSPLQQSGALRGQTVYVDIRQAGIYDGTAWIGTPLGDVSGYVNLITRNVGQLTTAGGTVDIDAGSSVVMQPGSAVDVSGGWINYQGGTVETTKVISNGILYDISQATPDRVYSGIYTGYTDVSAKYGLSQNYALATGAVYEAGYIQGGNGGSISITAPAVALDGSLTGNTVAGVQQVTPISQLAKTYAGTTFLPTTLSVSGVPDASNLTLTFQGNNPGSPGALTFPAYSPTPPNVIFENGASGQAPAGAFATNPTTGDPAALNPDRVSTVILSPDLVNSDGFGTLSIINSDGSIEVPMGVSLSAPLGGSVQISAQGAPVKGASGTTPVEGGSITFNAANITIDGSVTAPGGNLLFSVYDFSPYTILGGGAVTPSPDSTRGNFILGTAASLSTAGLVLDQTSNSGLSAGLPTDVDGGKITIESYNTDLVQGSRIDVSGGVVVTAANKQTFGSGGAITITAGQDLDYAALLGGKLTLGSTLEAYSGTTGGSLSITAPLIQIGGSSLQNGDTLASGETLWLDPTGSGGIPLGPEFFSQGGFGSFALSGLGAPVLDSQGHPVVDSAGNPEFMPAVLIAADTSVSPVAENWEVEFSKAGLYLASTTYLLPSQRTPISLAFNANGVTDSLSNLLVDRGDFVMGEGAVITTDPQLNATHGVTIHGQTAAILGSIIVPGGTISISGGSNFANLDAVLLQEPTVDLGPHSLLSTQGVVELTSNVYGDMTGSVLPGGAINVSGDIVAEAGAVLNVSGASGVLDVQPAQAGMAASISSTLVPLLESTNGGSITLTGSQELFTDATLIGAAGGSTATGGSLTVSSGIYLPAVSSDETPLQPTLLVTQSGETVPVASYYPAGETAIGNTVVDANGNVVAGMGYFAVSSFDNPTSGFDSLTLGGTIQFQGPINLTATNRLTIATVIKAPSGGIILADSPVTLTAPYVQLGQPFLGPQNAQEQLIPAYVNSLGGAYHVPPVFGAGSLAVNAALIDVGNLSLQGIGSADLTATNDVRGDGTFDIAGDLTVTAGQIYPLTETTFTLAAHDHNGVAGDITIEGLSSQSLPLSAGGTLNIYASDITQGGVLRAPIGTINLGGGVTSVTPADPVAGGTFDSAQELILVSGSETSVSAVDPTTGQALDIPYGTNVNGVEWLDPAGNNITTAGNGANAIPSASINVSAVNIQDQSGSKIDVSGGGDIYAYQFVTGTGGTVETLNLPNGSYAILPSSYSAAPQPSTYSPAYAGDGYSNQDSSVAVGQEIYLDASSGLRAGYYTLLPSIYALQPGAYLVTTHGSIESTGAAQQVATDASFVPGYLLNGNSPTLGQQLMTTFEVDPPSVVKTLGEYDISSGNTFFAQNATAAGIATPRLPIDAGQLVLAAQATLAIDGSVVSQVPTGGQGSLVDIASPSDILLAGTDADLSQVPSSTLVLSSSGLSNFGADSLLIGGYRGETTTAGTPITVTTSNLTVDNAGEGNALTGPDIILVSSDDLVLDAGAQIEQGSRTLTNAPTLVLGKSGSAGSGDGALLRVSSAATAAIIRQGTNSSGPALLSIGTGATISGTNLTLDSTSQSTLLTTNLDGKFVNIDSGLISLVLDTTGTSPSPSGLVLSDATLQNLQSSATALSLLSYGAIEIFGSGTIGGGLDAAGAYPIASFALHAGAIQGDGGTVEINAQNISIDDSAGGLGSSTAATATPGGSLTFNAAGIELGQSGQTASDGVSIQGYDGVALNASSKILLQGAGSTTSGTGTVTRGAFTLAVTGTTADSGNLTLDTALLTSATAANQTITVGGALMIESPSSGSSTAVASGLGAYLDLVGQSVADSGNIVLPGGTLTMEATTGDLIVGSQSPASIDLAGSTKVFNDLPEYTSGGQLTLTADAGSVALNAGSTLNLAAPSGGGNGAVLAINAPLGTFTLGGGTIQGSGGSGGTNGTFSIDVGTLNVSTVLGGNDLTPLETALTSGGFTQSQSIRVRGGSVLGAAYGDVYLEGTAAADSVTALTYNLSADSGSIIVDGDINASGPTGGSIDLIAAGSVTLTSQANLTVAGSAFSDAGKGGSVKLEAGSETNGQTPVSSQGRSGMTGEYGPGTAVVDIQSGSMIDLSVGTNSGSNGQTVSLMSSGSSFLTLPQATTLTLPNGTPGNDVIAFTSSGTVTSGGITTAFNAGTSLGGLAAGSTIQLDHSGTVMFAGGNAAAIPVALAANVNYTLGAQGDLTGTLHLRAPQLADGSDVQIDPIQGAVLNPSAVVLEGYKVYAPTGGLIDAGLQQTAYNDAQTFTENTNAILTSVLGAAPTAAQASLYQIAPGVEIVNTTGDLTFAQTWDLSTFRFGPEVDPNVTGSGVAGVLTLRAAGNVIFGYQDYGSASLSDGFTGYDGSTTGLANATLMPGQSWSYQITAGADFSAADVQRVQTPGNLASSGLGGSVQLGLNGPALPTDPNGAAELIIPQYFQVIRTGSGDITISAGNDVQLLNPLATIYTAGTEAADLPNFALPDLEYDSPILGSNPDTIYQAVYSQSGGNVSITAQHNIGDYLMNSSGTLVPTSTKEVPTSWLFRQGFVQDGLFAATNSDGPIAATSWWIDFGNFFEDVGALGGGNVSLVAGNDVSNVDASIPTNARMAGTSPSATALIELGGGDLLVQAGNDISGGVYYVERGEGILQAGGSIHSNSTRAALTQTQLSNLGQNPANATTWLPTTLFLGAGNFDVSANGSLLLGPVANPFLLPQSVYNSFLNKTYFSTYAETDSVDVSALTGTVTLKDNVDDVNGVYYQGPGSLGAWYNNVLLNTAGTFAQSQPWLALVETNTAPFDPAFALLPSTLEATAFSSDIDIVGSLVLSPSPTGTIDLVAAGSVNGFQPNAIQNPSAVPSSSNLLEWGETTLNLSDADPSSIPSDVNPLTFPTPATGFSNSSYAGTVNSLFANFASLFNESGATGGVLQTQEALHAPGLLHANDANPIRIYANDGSISGVTLYSGKFAQIEAGEDITDISLYVQNDNAGNITLVTAGRDLTAYDPQSSLRLQAQQTGNEFFGQNAIALEGTGVGAPANGDLQINGPGTLEVLAGRNFDLGIGTSGTNGISVGLTSVGNQRDPYLPFGGADVVVGSGISTAPDYTAFINQFLAPGTPESSRYLPDLGALIGLNGASDDQIWSAFTQLPPAQQDILAIDVFYLVLRDSGRDHNLGIETDPNYSSAFAAIAALFPGGTNQGDISLTSREIKTENGGNISLLAPGGQLTVGFDIAGNQPVDQGILTDDGGNISIFTEGNVNVGTSRIFTLSGGNEIIFSSTGNIAAGASSKTVQSAPPTRVVVDPQSGNVKTDLAGLATGGGIGVLETLATSAASDIDLIAPKGTVDAGDAGIRASGNLTIAAVQVLNAGNISVGGKSSGVPTTTAPNVSGLAAASSATGAANQEGNSLAQQQRNQAAQSDDDLPSIITVEVVGYGGA